ncbi:sorcin-like [Megalops cyprinoides]|uniref:sorcin-like n=1 Tax=Megalops cyprinoides TaxID=118141 RepID=UPI001865215C|nr:sorcin-like [Megalops cyprinoides]
MKTLLDSKGLTINSQTFELLWKRYSSKGRMTFDDFVASTVKLQALTDRFKKRLVTGLNCDCQVATFSLEEFIKTSLL